MNQTHSGSDSESLFFILIIEHIFIESKGELLVKSAVLNNAHFSFRALIALLFKIDALICHTRRRLHEMANNLWKKHLLKVIT